MLTKQGNRFTLNKTITLTERQLAKIKSLDEKAQKDYVLSIAGLYRKSITLSKDFSSKNKIDKLDRPRGSVLKRFERLLNSEESTLHKPIIQNSKTQWIGIEIECLFPSDSDENESCGDCDSSGSVSCNNCTGNGEVELEDEAGHIYRISCRECGGDGSIECSSCEGNSNDCDTSSIRESIRMKLRNTKITRCSVKSDGSLSEDGHIGVEVTILLDANRGFEPLIKVCKILNDMGAIVNKTCGLHVHIDTFGLSRVEAKAKGYQIGKFLPIMSKLVPKSRLGNNYCKLSVSSLDGCRYHAVNLTALAKHNTIEVRLHSGTTSDEKIINWVSLLLAIFRIKRAPSVAISEFQKLIDLTKIDSKLVEYFDRRHSRFSGPSDNHDNESQGVSESITDNAS